MFGMQICHFLIVYWAEIYREYMNNDLLINTASILRMLKLYSDKIFVKLIKNLRIFIVILLRLD